ncbi:hypothetical protein [Sphingomonas sp. Leaf357]|uniref:hypothetical protein n=1 Tax=Sphingomonas sp. Leaf357 TaxID=1736350 RepID=UPI0012E28052|nr:hypothetical protein [Sphingomonas sp. Leaf357]
MNATSEVIGPETLKNISKPLAEHKLIQMVDAGKLSEASFNQILKLIPSFSPVVEKGLNFLLKIASSAANLEERTVESFDASLGRSDEQLMAVLSTLETEEAKLEALHAIISSRKDSIEAQKFVVSKAHVFRHGIAVVGGAVVVGFVALIGSRKA